MLFDEVGKIKSWKAKVDSETVKNDRRLQENKRVIETQRKAIQDLQVCDSLQLHGSLRLLKPKTALYTGELSLNVFIFLQFENEGLSIKLDEQIHENLDLTNK